jgi:hypothetical protein
VPRMGLPVRHHLTLIHIFCCGAGRIG